MRVYIAGPITKGNQMDNIRAAIDAADEVLRAGHAPYCPHLTFFWHMIYPHQFEAWMALDKEWLGQCAAVIRLPGESEGADREVAWARDLGRPVFSSVQTFLEWTRPL